MSALSLNNGAELDNEDSKDILPVFEDPVPGEIPGLAEDAIQIETLDTALEGLIDLAADIRTTGGINRQFAMEAERIMPNTLSNPTNYYSNVPSATLLKVSMEEIDKGIWALIAAGTIAVIALIVKIVGWFSGNKGDDAKTGDAKKTAGEKADAVNDAQDGATEVVETMQDLNKEMHNRPIEWTTTNGTKIVYNSMDNVIAEVFTDDARYGRARKFLSEPNPIHVDIVESGPYTSFIYKTVDKNLVRNITSALEQRIKLLKELSEEDRESGSARLMHLDKQFDRLKEPLTFNHNGAPLTLKELHQRMSAARASVEQVTPKKNIHFDHLFNSIHTAMKRKDLGNTYRELPSLFEAQEKLKKTLEDLRSGSGDHSMDGNPGTNTEGVAVRIRESVLKLGQEVSQLGMVLHSLDTYYRDYMYLVNEVVGFSKQIVAKISSDMDRSGGEVPADWKKLLKERRKELDAIEEKAFGSVWAVKMGFRKASD